MKKIAAFLLILLLLTSCARSGAAELTVTFFDAGKADAILVKTDEAAVLIDAGLNKNGDELVENLQALGVSALDAMIITHFDKDHVGGADAVLRALPVAEALESHYDKESKQRTQYEDALRDSAAKQVIVSEEGVYTFGDLQFTIIPARLSDYGKDQDNDMSLVAQLVFDGGVILFAGDAENTRLYELISRGGLESDVLKVPHHGRIEDASAAFFKAVSPKIAVITSSGDEPEDAQVLSLLSNAGAEIYLTREGTVVLTYDGEHYAVSQN